MTNKQTELQAWQNLCAELRRLNVDINSENKLNQALIEWGKSFAILRLEAEQAIEH